MTRILLAILCIATICSSSHPQEPSKQLPSKEQVDALERRILLHNVWSLLADIDVAETSLIHFKDTNNELIRKRFDIWNQTIKQSKEKLKEYEPKFQADPQLLVHAKMVLAEQKRMDKEALAKGLEYFKSKEYKDEHAKKLVEYMNSFDRVPGLPTHVFPNPK